MKKFFFLLKVVLIQQDLHICEDWKYIVTLFMLEFSYVSKSSCFAPCNFFHDSYTHGNQVFPLDFEVHLSKKKKNSTGFFSFSLLSGIHC